MLKLNCRIKTKNELYATLVVPKLIELESKGSGDVEVLDVMEKVFTVCVDGSGDVVLKGTVGVIVIELNGSGDVKAAELKSTYSFIENNGEGDIEIEVAKSVTIDSKGTGDILVEGTADSIVLTSSGSGDIDASNLEVKFGITSSQGAGDVYAKITENACANSEGAGDINISGNPKTQAQTAKGTGDINIS